VIVRGLNGHFAALAGLRLSSSQIVAQRELQPLLPRSPVAWRTLSVTPVVFIRHDELILRLLTGRDDARKTCTAATAPQGD
jgi:hypothetical protein